MSKQPFTSLNVIPKTLETLWFPRHDVYIWNFRWEHDPHQSRKTQPLKIRVPWKMFWTKNTTYYILFSRTNSSLTSSQVFSSSSCRSPGSSWQPFSIWSTTTSALGAEGALKLASIAAILSLTWSLALKRKHLWAFGLMGYWLRAHSGLRNNCFSKIQTSSNIAFGVMWYKAHPASRASFISFLHTRKK